MSFQASLGFIEVQPRSERSALCISAALLRHQGNATVFSDRSTTSHFQLPRRSHLTTVIYVARHGVAPSVLSMESYAGDWASWKSPVDYPTQVENRQQRIEALRPPRPLRQDRRGEADFLLGDHVAPVAHLGATDLDRPHPGFDCPMRPMAMAHDTVAAIRQFQILPHGDKGIQLRRSAPEPACAGAFTCKFAQRIVDGLRLTERKNSAISRQ